MNEPGRRGRSTATSFVLLVVAIASSACGTGQAPTTLATQQETAARSLAPTTATEPSVATSPSALPLPGGRLVFQQLIGDSRGLLTSNTDGTGIKPLLPFGIGEGPRWSPDGLHISVVDHDQQGRLFVGLVNPDGSNYVKFESPDPRLDLGCAAWSPDGSRLACEGWDDTDPTRNGIYTVRSSDGGALTRVTASPNGGHDIPANYSPDGRQIVFTRVRLPDEADTTMMVVNVDGSDARAISDQRLGGGSWSRDGRTILADADSSFLLVPIDGGAPTVIKIVPAGGLRTAFSGSWSPDGEWIVFSGRASKSVDLYIVRADGSDLHQVTDTPIGLWEEGADWAAPR
jgi:Tol biopolymer transport system component